MQVDLLCSGSKGNSCLIRTKNSSLLIDCGSTKKYLMNALGSVNQRVDDLNALLVTHAHTDHVSQLKHFRHLPVYSYCDLKDLDNHRIVRPLQEFDVNEFHIQVISLSHDSPNTVGYVIYADGKKLVYVTDTGYVSNEVKTYLENADYYIFESNHDIETLMNTNRPMFLFFFILGDSGHLNNLDASSNLASLINSKTKEIVLAHISEEANDPSIALKCIHDHFLKKDLPYRGVNIRAAKQHEILTIKSF